MIDKLTNDESLSVLSENNFGHIGCNDGFNTYIFPTNYVFDGNHVICHSQEGAKVQVMRSNRRVCLQVDKIKDRVNWKSIIIHGQFQELKDSRQRLNAIKIFLDNMLSLKGKRPGKAKNESGKSVHPILNGSMHYVIYRIMLDEISGRYEVG